MKNNDLIQRLMLLDEEAYLLYPGADKFYCIIVGGSALMLMGYVNRVTHDIDSIQCHNQLLDLIGKYDINMNVMSHIDCFPEDYGDRIQKLEKAMRAAKLASLASTFLGSNPFFPGR